MEVNPRTGWPTRWATRLSMDVADFEEVVACHSVAVRFSSSLRTERSEGPSSPARMTPRFWKTSGPAWRTHAHSFAPRFCSRPRPRMRKWCTCVARLLPRPPPRLPPRPSSMTARQRNPSQPPPKSGRRPTSPLLPRPLLPRPLQHLRHLSKRAAGTFSWLRVSKQAGWTEPSERCPILPPAASKFVAPCMTPAGKQP